MISSMDKALVAMIMGFLFILNSIWGINIGLSQETVGVIVGALTPLLVFLVPNKPKPK